MNASLKSKMNSKVDGYIRKHDPWQESLQLLREIVLDSELVEDVKWRTPCYTLDDRNVIIIGAYKDYSVISFLKGTLLKDPKKILQESGPNSQSVKVIRFASIDEIRAMQRTLKAYVKEAIDLEKSGAKVQLKKITEFEKPAEFQKKLDEDPALRKAFESLTPGRQRGYLLHFSSAKQSATREARVEKCRARILSGKGLDDD